MTEHEPSDLHGHRGGEEGLEAHLNAIHLHRVAELMGLSAEELAVLHLREHAKGFLMGDREALKSMLGEGFHSAFRKGCVNLQADVIWQAIRDMPVDDWLGVLEFVISGMERSHFVEFAQK